MSSSTKIAVHSLADLKNTTDDHLPLYLHTLKFKQIHTKTDTRLLLGYTAVLISGVLFAYDYAYGWTASKPFTLPAVLAYFALNGAFTAYTWFVEAGTVYEGESKTGSRLRIASATKKHVPVYEVDAWFTPAPVAKNPEQKISIRAPMTRWFTADGYFVARPLEQWLASEIPVVGEADPEGVVEDIGRGSGMMAAQDGSTLNVTAENAMEVLQQLKASGAKIAKGDGGAAKRRKA